MHLATTNGWMTLLVLSSTPRLWSPTSRGNTATAATTQMFNHLNMMNSLCRRQNPKWCGTTSTRTTLWVESSLWPSRLHWVGPYTPLIPLADHMIVSHAIMILMAQSTMITRGFKSTFLMLVSLQHLICFMASHRPKGYPRWFAYMEYHF
ncbi:unnamed protein product [Coffea canephora]|uniref:Secreted protein n=1 Tax=Coffea canephora TaxID=49390 RepID=A0A068UR93_COFCA|nr:unnamed protein product [Coffea canephora]